MRASRAPAFCLFRTENIGFGLGSARKKMSKIADLDALKAKLLATPEFRERCRLLASRMDLEKVPIATIASELGLPVDLLLALAFENSHGYYPADAAFPSFH